ncbi:MAG: hypothetical protein OEV00_00420 [Acidobacteriota bacterium]|nr:hypothetical protein [Acidobacteriota bacterium]MDH3783767.1 hypothetical protein [Acidobacteriota bacterium]
MRFVLILAMIATFGGAAVAAPPASSPSEVSPLDVGASVPDVQVRDRSGEFVDFRALIAGRPAAIIFYRGGW